MLLCREWFQHPSGALPAYEWDFGDVNPPVQAWAALEVFALDGATTWTSCPGCSTSCWSTSRGGSTARTPTARTCSRAASWAWTTSARSTARTCRSAGTLEQSDSTGWMAGYAASWPRSPRSCTAAATGPRWTWCRRSSSTSPLIRDALDGNGLWDEADGMFYDRLTHARRHVVPIKVRSIASMIPMLAGGVVNERAAGQHAVGDQAVRPVPAPPRPARRPAQLADAGLLRGPGGSRRLLVSVVGVDRVEQMLGDAARPGRVPRPARPAVAVGRATATTRRAGVRRAARGRRLRARRVDDARCSAATPTGAGRCGSR